MSSVVISGNTSGAITLSAPAVAGTNTITLPALTGTVVVAGQNSAITAGAAVASTSGTSIDFTSIPSWVKRITVMFQGVSTNGASFLQIQVGAGSVTTSGYLGSGGDIIGATASTFTSGFGTQASANAAHIRNGAVRITNFSGNNWVADGVIGLSNGGQIFLTGGSIALGGTLDRVRITTVNGTDTFDAGTINILWE